MARSGSASGARAIAAIERLDAEARGVSPGARPILVPGVLPGEQVEVQVEHEGQQARYARLLAVAQASPERVEPGCAHFLDCGGCDFLHASLAAQHAYKRARVAAALGLALTEVAEVVPSPDAFEYRSLAKMVFGDRILGSYRPRSHDVVDMSGCRVHHPEVEAVLKVARAWLLGHLSEDLRYLVVRRSAAGSLSVLLVAQHLASTAAESLAEALAPAVAEVMLLENDQPGDAIFVEGPQRRLAGTPQAAVAAFVQINPGAAERLYQQAVALLAPAGAPVLELYAGAGGLSRALLRAGAAEVVSFERVEAAVQVSQAEAAAAGLSTRLQAGVGAAEAASLPALPLVIVNPPRKGLGSVVARLSTWPWERLVYVSCNPDSLARDLAGFRAVWPELCVRQVVPVDLFPQTRHIETVVLLERR